MLHSLGVQMWVLCPFLLLMIAEMVSEDDPLFIVFWDYLRFTNICLLPKLMKMM